MGIVNSKEPRRISFDNTLSVNPTLVVNPSVAVEKSITEQPETNVFQLPHIEHTENIFHDVPPKSPLKNIDSPESDIDYKYWANRVEGLKKEHQIIKGIIESEFINTLKTTNEICPPQVITQEKIQKVKPCVDWRFKMTKCYEDNPQEPLMCSEIVNAFSKCVASCKYDDIVKPTSN
ncbi:unnamed protein product [Plutella xylostella]|uniref:(diamondback moth) hypothetical protein n=1 Tax=Plutella xylostella TaxID=51655 RepID=A0A8S4ENM8_PLUXY|nr:unnamed protein product [Plutella xylostella]